MLKVGITGGIGSGKSVISNVFELLGIPVFNSDVQAKILMNDDQSVRADLIELLGDNAYDDNGLNRTFLRKKIFENDQLLTQVNQIVHPAVRNYFTTWIKKNEDAPYIIQEAAILIESGAYNKLDYLILIYAPEEIRLKRTIKRDKTSRENVKNIIAKQLPDEQKKEQADLIIYNYNSNLVVPQILNIHQMLLSKKMNHFKNRKNGKIW